MRFKVVADNRLHALFCAIVLLVCALLTKPYVEMGISDDFSYVRSAQVLAQTGHIVYNGWATAILGWQLYLGALFIKLFGFSFTSARASIIVVSVFTAYLLHRVMTGFGLTAWSATLATLTVVLSPVWLILEVSFMSDSPGLLCLVLCLYAGQRAIQASDDASAVRWIWFAGILNILDGTVRQTAWLGVLVMVPATAWLLRRRRNMVLNGLLVWIIGIVSVLVFLHWFKTQPYTNPFDSGKVPKLPTSWHMAAKLAKTMARSLLSLPLMALSVMMLLVSRLPNPNRRKIAIATYTVTLLLVALAAAFAVHASTATWLTQFLPPWIGDNVTLTGVMQSAEIRGNAAAFLGERMQIGLGLAVLVSSGYLAAQLALRSPAPKDIEVRNGPAVLSWKETRFLLLPFTAAYFALLLPRAGVGMIFDRYLTPLVMVLTIFLLRYAQQRLAQPAYWLGGITLLLFTCFAVAGTHDLFAFDRARLQAANEVRDAGVPRTSLEGGFEYDGWTQILATGYIPDPGLITGAPNFKRDDCRGFFYIIAPAVEPDYILSFDSDTCYGPSKFPAAPYHTWLPPHNRKVYVQKVH